MDLNFEFVAKNLIQMVCNGLRPLSRWKLRRSMRRVMREMSPQELAESAIVFAPHPDDETLGCGGTIIRKKEAGARVRIVFVTDGAKSHAHLLSPEKLRLIRAGEAVDAALALGAEREDVTLLGLPDGQLSEHEEDAIRKVSEILRRDQPASVFIPYYLDQPPDHQATTRIVLRALERTGSNATVYEYPIWFWHHWPFVDLDGGLTGRWRGYRETRPLNKRLLEECRCFVRINGVREQKREALAQHRSQMERLVNDPSWMILSEAGHGEWLQCFFGDREIFYRHPFQPGSKTREEGALGRWLEESGCCIH